MCENETLRGCIEFDEALLTCGGAGALPGVLAAISAAMLARDDAFPEPPAR